MAKKTILIYGSSGFLMSNFIRYLLYRTNDYKIVGIDNLSSPEAKKNIYIHKNFVFNIGDISDREVVKKVGYLHDPDIIINAANPNSCLNAIDTIVKGAFNIRCLQKPTIQIVPSIWECDPNGWWNSAAMTTNGIVLEVPNCFGRRQSTAAGVASLIRQCVDSEAAYVHPNPVPWVFSDDVASMLWFLVESLLEGREITAENGLGKSSSRVKMPVIGRMSERSIVEIINQEFKLSARAIDHFKNSADGGLYPFIDTFDDDVVEGWESDYKNGMTEPLIKTVRWYFQNKWAINV